MFKSPKAIKALASSLVILAASAMPAVAAEPVGEAALLEHIKILASDEYGGRKPGTDGENKTIAYIADQWSKAGLVSGTHEGSKWYAPVSLIQRKPMGQSYSFYDGKKRFAVKSDQLFLRGKQSEAALEMKRMIFTGYGVDGKAMVIADVKGKVAFMLFSNPPYVKKNAGFQTRRKKLFEAGASAVIAVNDSKMSWLRIKRAFSGGSTVLESRDKTSILDGVISQEMMGQAMRFPPKRVKSLIKAADKAGFRSVNSRTRASFATTTQVREFVSQNVIAKLPGKNPEAGAVLYMGHWDHLGQCRGKKSADRICNGAVDNASGIAALIEVAKRLGKEPQADRDIYFVATTAEEMGLLGAYAFAENPAVSLDKIAVALNVDTIAIAPRGAKVAIIGRGETDLDDIADDVAKSLGRKIEKSKAANAFIQRQDGWALAAKKVPALMVGGSFSDLELMGKFLGKDYHTPKDEVNESLELGGAAEDADLHVALGEFFADSGKYPIKNSYLTKKTSE